MIKNDNSSYRPGQKVARNTFFVAPIRKHLVRGLFKRYVGTLLMHVADGHVLNSSVSCHQNYPPNWDLHEMIRYKEEKCFSYDGKRIKWLDTLEMLKIFTKNVVGQLGNCLSPGGRYKKFVSSNSDLILTWNYENGTLSFKGKVGDSLKELFISMHSTKEGKAASRCAILVQS